MRDTVLKNTHWDDRFTCPACLHDHIGEVDACDGCGVKLRCTVEMVPESVCAIDDGSGDDVDE